MKVLPGHVPEVISRLTPTGRLAATRELHLAIGLPLRDSAGLDDFLAQLYNPASPNFHRYLTVDEAAARFGPSAEDYEAVKNFARTNGLTVTTSYHNRLVLDVTGPAAAVEKAFHLTLRTYRHPTEPRDFFAPDTEPTVDAQLPVADIQGLSDFSRPHPQLHQLNAAQARAMPQGGSAPNNSGAYFGNDFRNAYVPGTPLTGAGQTFGLFEVDGFYANDISAYAAAAGNGRTNIVIQTVLLDGFSGTPTTGSDSGNPEVSLDIEMAMAIAPGLTTIVVYEGNPNDFIPNDILNGMLAGSNTVKNLSSSWGWSGGPSVTTDNIFKNMAVVGQSFFNAAGDSCAFTTGASSVNGVDNSSLSHAPASSPYIMQVGGTTLSVNGAGTQYGSETVWNWGNEIGPSYNGVGGSGGISSHYPIPSWQTGVNPAAAGGSASSRNIPDVALTADNIYVTFGNGTSGEFGGTSCAAPLWAGFISLVNQQAASFGLPPVGFINPALYAIASGPNYAACFHDVTTGNNTWSNSPDLFYATNGYDLCTGLGTPAGTNLINALASPADTLVIAPLAGAATGVAGGPFTVTSGNFLLSNSTNNPLNWSLVTTSAWLAVSPTGGVLAGGAQTNLTVSFTSAASNLVVGTYLASLIFSNGITQVVQTGNFTLQVSQPLLVLPTNGYAASGPAGGPFYVTSQNNATSQNFVLTNQSVSALSWSITNSPSWLNVSPSSGTLAGDAQTTVTVSLTDAADDLAYGTYTADLFVTNFAGLAASLPFTITAINTNLPIVENGGFETGDLTGWTLNGNSSQDFVTPTAAWVHSGSYGLALGQHHSLGSLTQTLTTAPGQNYLLSLWLADPESVRSAIPNQFIVLWNGTTLFNQSNIPFISWTNLQFMVTATNSSTVLQFEFEDSSAFLALDDISVVPFLPPSFQTAPQPANSTGFNLAWSTIAGQVYQIQYTTNLLQPNWVNLGGPQTATSGMLTLQDTNAITSASSRFYRVVEQQ